MYAERIETQMRLATYDKNETKEVQFTFDSRAGGKAFIYELKRREQRFLIAIWACNEENKKHNMISLGYLQQRICSCTFKRHRTKITGVLEQICNIL